ncbi:MAG: LysM peptidoglycan-binding domain-containing protein [Lentisphaeria bacterium]|nr:LysM peptidoglycan-binding domain-containing protein [Lentisphaeria bacterium]
MRKNYFFAITGAGLLLAGCADPIMDNHQYRTIPVDDISTTGEKAPAAAAETGKKQKAAAVVENKTQTAESQFKYEPMTDAVSSGGVDSVPGKKVKSGKRSSDAVSAAGGAYIVQRGDTPERIARKYKVRLSEFMKANNLTEETARRLRVGQKLVIPGKTAAVAAKKAPAVSSQRSEKAPALEKGKYKVQRGDSLERIARRFKVKLKDLMAVNNITEEQATRLQIGQALTIPGAVPPPPIVNDVQAVGSDEKTAVAPAVEEKKEQTVVENKTVVEKKEVKVDSAQNSQADEADNYVVWEADADTTYAAVAAKYGISEEKLRNINTAGEAQQITKGDLIFVPQK